MNLIKLKYPKQFNNKPHQWSPSQPATIVHQVYSRSVTRQKVTEVSLSKIPKLIYRYCLNNWISRGWKELFTSSARFSKSVRQTCFLSPLNTRKVKVDKHTNEAATGEIYSELGVWSKYIEQQIEVKSFWRRNQSLQHEVFQHLCSGFRSYFVNKICCR